MITDLESSGDFVSWEVSRVREQQYTGGYM